ncbi:MAG: TonB-dependent receptor domain-containing protein [Candidatus Zixiibacteriota bacterium]
MAGITGKISGIVISNKTGEPIIGATVRVQSTNMVTKTDIDGEYFIINIPGGKYDISVTNVGFEAIVKKEVRVLVDLTTPVDFTLKEETIVLGEKVVVYAENPIIQKDLTGSKIIFTSDRLKTLPNIVTIQSVLTNYPGVVMDRDNSLHVRGGRSGQVAYYYDGFSVQDPFVASSGIHIIPNSLEELTLASGGYSAEYGEALSGVVSAITREGTEKYKGSIKMYEGFTHTYDVNNAKWGDLKRYGNRSVAFNLSGPVPAMNSIVNTFNIAGEYIKDPTTLPHNDIKTYTSVAKFSLQPLSNLRLISNFTYYEADGKVYEHRDVNGRSYDFNLDGLPLFKKKSYLIGVSGNYNFNENMILSTRFNRFYTTTKSAPEDLFDIYWNKWPGYSEDSTGKYNGTIHEDNYGNNPDFSDPSQLVGFTTGDDFDPTYRKRESQYNAFHSSIINQVNKHNQLKAGFEYRKYKVDWDFKQFFNSQPYGEIYSSKPTYFSLFFQDKMEYEFFIIKVGLRYDYRNADISYNITPQAQSATFKKADSKSKVSPRLGVSFPITEKSVMHFNYGVYYQVPKYTYLYTNLQGDISSGFPLLGNPDLDLEQTTSYEMGLDHLVGDNLKMDITAYHKDIKDLVTTRSTFKVAGSSVTTFMNDDYGSVEGIDINLEKLPLNSYFSGSIAYSYMNAKGNGSYALEPYYTFLTSSQDTLAPVSEYPLDFDQRHTLTGVLDFRVPPEWEANFLGMKIPGDWGIDLVGHYGSGLPFTLTDVDGNRLGDRNEGRLPVNYTVDMRFNKNFKMNGGRYELSFFAEVDNLFNRRNVINVYNLTGRADYDAYTPTATLSTSQEEINKWDRLFDNDPQNYSRSRTIRTGLEFNF